VGANNMKFTEADRLLFELAQENARSNKIDIAVNQLNELIAKYPKNGLLRAVLANNYWDLGILDKAEIEFNEAVKLYPKNEHCSLGFFHFLWEQDKQIEALDEIKRFLSIAKSAEYDEILKGINEAIKK